MVKLKYFGVGVFILASVALVSAGCIPGAGTVNTDLDSSSMENGNSGAVAETKDGGTMMEGDVKEITMTSFYEIVDDQPKPQFSITEINVKKGDKVRIKVTNTKGNHDINIDEFNVSAETPLGQEVVVEFVADKVGTFEYYCSKPGHRELGHWGTLTVTE